MMEFSKIDDHKNKKNTLSLSVTVLMGIVLCLVGVLLPANNNNNNNNNNNIHHFGT